MEIVVLDGFTLNPGDISWNGLKALGNVTIYDRTPADKVVERAAGAEVVLTNKTPIPEEAINQLSSLKFIGVLATGYNIVNTEAAKKKGDYCFQCSWLWNDICSSNDHCFIIGIMPARAKT